MAHTLTARQVLAQARLYGIVDLGYVAEEDIESATAKMCAGGVDLLQLRAKGFDDLAVEQMVHRLQPICEDAGVPLIINDFPELVPATGAAGAHVGQDDLPIEEARWRAGRSLGEAVTTPIIGRSTHSPMQAKAAAEEGADYIGFGPLYLTGTKPGRPAIGLHDIHLVHQSVTLPVFCIGGVKRENLDTVLEAGARRVVIVSGILQAPDITEYCMEVKARLQEFPLAQA